MATTEQVPIAQVAIQSADRRSMRSPDLVIATQCIALITVCALVLYRHVITALIVNWWNDPNYSHSFLMPLFAGLVIWKMRSQLLAMPLRPTWWGFLPAIVAMALLVVGDLGAELFSSRISLLVLLVGVTLLLLGWNHLKALMFAWAMLLLTIPIPAIVLNQITFPLQLTASQFATSLLSVVGVPVLRDGNVIQLPATSLEVVEACSGIRSLISLIALAAIFGYLKGHPVWKRWTLVILAAPVAVLANSFRIMGTGLLAQYWDPDKAEGFFHMFEGWVIFVLSLCLLLLLDRVLSRFSPKQEMA